MTGQVEVEKYFYFMTKLRNARPSLDFRTEKKVPVNLTGISLLSFPEPGGNWQVSTGGGEQPQWRRDGKDIFYIASDQELIAVAVKGNATLEVGAPTALFPTRLSFVW